MRYYRTTIISCAFAAFLCGLGLVRASWWISAELLICLALFWLVTLKRFKKLTLIATILLAMGLGIWRGQSFRLEAQKLDDLAGTKVSVQVTALSDGSYNERGQLEFEASNLTVGYPLYETLPGRITASGFGEPAVFKGDVLQLTGRFYKTRGSKQLGISFAQIELLERRQNVIETVRREFAAGLASVIPEPQASFGLGLLIGQRDTLPETTKSQLAAVGLTHIIAVSGYNLTILVRGVRRLLVKRSKYQSTMLSLMLIGVFLLMTGMSASIVRASIISVLSILAWHYGRTFKPVLLLLLTAALTAGWNPFYLWSDIGWYLSFLAFFGVLILAPLLSKKIFNKAEPNFMQGIVLESISAFIMTAPLIIYIFKQISLIALPANLLIVPAVPFAMLFTALAGLAGMLAPAIGGLFALPATWLLTTILDIVHLLSKIPHIMHEVSMNTMGLITFYACLVLVTVVLWHKNTQTVKLTDIKTKGL